MTMPPQLTAPLVALLLRTPPSRHVRVCRAPVLSLPLWLSALRPPLIPCSVLQAFYAAVQNAGGDVADTMSVADDNRSVMESLMAPSEPPTPSWSVAEGSNMGGGESGSMYGGSAAPAPYSQSIAESFVAPSAPPSDAGTAAMGSSYGQQLSAYTAPPEPAPAFMQPVPNYPESAYSQSMYSYQSGYQVKTVRLRIFLRSDRSGRLLRHQCANRG